MASLTALFLLLCLVTYSFAYPARIVSGNQYDEGLARRMLDMSAAAYSQSPQKCFNETFGEQENWQIMNDINSRCDFLHDTCSVFIAFSDEEREILISFRGTNSKIQLFLEGFESLEPDEPFNNMGYVLKYFKDSLDKIWPTVEQTLLANNNNYNVIFTGHSLGGALASLAASQTVAHGLRTSNQVKLITFGQPRVGDYNYAINHDRIVPYSYRVVHKGDIVPHVPSCSKSNGGCAPHNHSPYHHGTEIWYPDGMAPNARFVTCTNQPVDEDHSCSNNLPDLKYSIADHLHYFEHMVSSYGENGCKDGAIISSVSSLSLMLLCLCFALFTSHRSA